MFTGYWSAVNGEGAVAVSAPHRLQTARLRRGIPTVATPGYARQGRIGRMVTR
jgi:hypothetical protein